MIIDGPAGPLEADLIPAPGAAAAIAVLCHPHPQYGGSMHDAVLATAAIVLARHGAECLRFNFRGVGASAGSFDQGVGEVDDVLAAVSWARTERPNAALWLVGYSFGAAMAWRALARTTPARTILIAPPVGMMDLADPAAAAAGKILAIAGDADNFVDASAFGNWAGVETHLLPDADHFFMGHHDALGREIDAWLNGASDVIKQ